MLGKKITFCKQNQQIAETSTHEPFPLEGGLCVWGLSSMGVQCFVEMPADSSLDMAEGVLGVASGTWVC